MCCYLYSYLLLEQVEVNEIGNLYVYKSYLVCKSEFIKRLIEGNYSIEFWVKSGKMLFFFYFHDPSPQEETL